jgi:hypothetical protein
MVDTGVAEYPADTLVEAVEDADFVPVLDWPATDVVE